MVRNGELSRNDPAIRQGGTEWQSVGSLFPELFQAPAPAAAAVPFADAAPDAPAKKGRGKMVLLGCGGFLVLALLIGGVLGFLAYRNLFPEDSKENLPDAVKDFKLDNRYPPKGNIWGTETQFVGLYSNKTINETVLYMMTVYSDAKAAEDAFKSELAGSCRSGEKAMRFTFKDSGGKEVSKGATCAAPLFVLNGNRLARLGGSGGSVNTFVTFAENLPFNKGTTMKNEDEK